MTLRILDIRGSSGGNDRWPREWVRRFTGCGPVYNTIGSELMSKATRSGRRQKRDDHNAVRSTSYWHG